MKILNAFSALEVSKIPKSQGLYAFYLDTISYEKVGLLGKGPFQEQSLINAKKILQVKVKKILRFMHSNNMHGQLVGQTSSPSIESGFSLLAERKVPQKIFEKINDLEASQVPKCLNLLKGIPLLSQPIYVGITEHQTLFDRYSQHRQNYESGAGTENFGSRFAASGFEWDDLLFTCIEFEKSEEDLDLLKIVEKYLQILSKPILSIT